MSSENLELMIARGIPEEDHWNAQHIQLYQEENFNLRLFLGPHDYKPMDNNIWHHLPNVKLNKFDGFEPSGWVTQMEHYFSLHGITYDMMELRAGSLYLDLE
jgi:hypothetical protein